MNPKHSKHFKNKKNNAACMHLPTPAQALQRPQATFQCCTQPLALCVLSLPVRHQRWTTTTFFSGTCVQRRLFRSCASHSAQCACSEHKHSRGFVINTNHQFVRPHNFQSQGRGALFVHVAAPNAFCAHAGADHFRQCGDHSGRITDMTFVNERPNVLVSSSLDGNVRVWDMRTCWCLLPWQ